ncbi:hypothetical protein LTR20_007767 [Exophiala xenobiotica]|nr:hypothetical protein LTS06_003005 [Exophiala xenobiotica]KAK5319462.1 hypothetical protein LTR93_007382 [Exophiala xenobiotica]KAK5356893.1 hypothetical protein LTR61_000629 [Exophiala xenobiotica]KAK5377047.1 hypothetical protein LTR11_004712 [Exophiala xenobiotica]KAK5459096.1 hypothetical protein LTR20_007767 [Exophiala xenobiotica]
MGLGIVSQLILYASVQLHNYVAGSMPQEVLQGHGLPTKSSIEFTSSWSVLGPFRIGTREAVWGADPTEQYGGVRQLDDNDTTSYHSPLARNATVQWSSRSFSPAASKTTASVELVVDFPDIDWEFTQKIYGWSAFQYQAWLRGGVWNHDSIDRRVALYPGGILELWFNDIHVFGGDFYTFGNAPLVVDLRPGLNVLNVRLVRDVRSMGGSFPPTSHAILRAEVAAVPVEVVHDSILLPDVVKDQFVSRYASVVVRSQAKAWINISGISASFSGKQFALMDQWVLLAPGQSRPLKMQFDFLRVLTKTVTFTLNYTLAGQSLRGIIFEAQLRHTEPSSLQKMTFLHTSGAVSYATLRPPPMALADERNMPVLLNLHGAGVDADGDLARHMFDDTPELPAWILTPTGMTPWSGDDWHTWGFANAQAAVSAIPSWIKSAGWKGPRLYSDKVLVVGHSNGGQGTWYFVSHQPDRVLGAAAASGYSSIENYVPYLYWNEADPLQSAVLNIARSNYRHELLVENLAGLPIFQQHGSADDNVPPYHSRLMNTLLAQAGNAAEYAEMHDKGHWIDGTMTTPSMIDFYSSHLEASDDKMSVPGEFVFVVPNSADVGSKYGIVVDQLLSPDRLGHIEVCVMRNGSATRWHLRTHNIRRLHFDPTIQIRHRAEEVLLDDVPHVFDVRDQTNLRSLVLMDSDIWTWEVSPNWRNLDQRYGRQRGALDSILRSAAAFEIVYCSNESLPLAVQASRNFLQYFGADSNIGSLDRYGDALSRDGNVITICLSKSLPAAQFPLFPIHVEDDRVLLTTKQSHTISIPLKPGMGGVWLRPLPDERLELVVWGCDDIGLQQAARLIPTLTGAGQPDFVILDNEARWKGHGGAIAMGFFDFNWRISSASYLP